MENQQLKKLISNKELLYEAGFIGNKTLLHIEVWVWIDTRIKKNKITKNKAVMDAIKQFNLSESTIWRIMRKFAPSLRIKQ